MQETNGWKPHAHMPPQPRDQLSLNGLWDDGEIVPRYDWQSFDRKSYSRKVAVPAAWKGRTIKIEFDGVNFASEIFVDGRSVAGHVGGWVKFAVDLTPFVAAGKSFDLKVEVSGRRVPPTPTSGATRSGPSANPPSRSSTRASRASWTPSGCAPTARSA